MNIENLFDHFSDKYCNYVLNEKDREEMRKYRQLAIDVQNRIKKFRDYLTDCSSAETDIPDDNFSTTESTDNNYFTDFSIEDSSVAKFSQESCQKDILQMLEDDDKNNRFSSSTSDDITPISDAASINNTSLQGLCDVPSKPITDNLENQKSDMVENFEKLFVECSNFELEVNENQNDNCDNGKVSKIEDTKNNNVIENSSDENYATANETIDCDKTPHKLIRSNSFILENPSPLLIAQIEKEKQISEQKNTSPPKPRKTWNTSLQSELFPQCKSSEDNILSRRNAEILNDKVVMGKKTDNRRSWFATKRRSFEEQRKLKTAPISNKKTTIHKRKGWDLSNAKEKWCSIENDIGNTKYKVTKKFNSVPSSTTTSPNEKMFQTFTKSEPKKVAVSPITPPNLIKTPDVPKIKEYVPKRQLFMSTPRKKTISQTQNVETKKIRGFVTPVRTIQDLNNIPTREYSPKRAQSVPRNVYISPKATENHQKTAFTITSKERPTYFVSVNDKCMGDSLGVIKIVPEKENDIVKFPKIPIEDNINRILTPEKLVSPISTLNISTAQNDLKDIFVKMQEVQKQQMDELLKKQKREQELFLQKFAEQQTLLLRHISQSYSSPESQIQDTKNTSKNLLPENKILIEPPSPTLAPQICDKSPNEPYLSIYNSNDTLNDPNLTLRTDTDNSIDEITIKYKSSPSNNNDYHVVTSAEFRKSVSSDSLETATCLTNSLFNGDKIVAQIEKNVRVCVDPRSVEQKKMDRGCVKELFPSSEQVQAATVICAAVRGYLVRRLLRTEKVQNLIQTIKDTLLCAMELHHESVENIQPADIELHRRLIQQVTAACLSFHDTFFKLSIKEQMTVISQDRERQKEKLLRPTSARSSSSISTTTQKVLERKHRRESSLDFGTHSNRSSFSRSSQGVETIRARTRSVGPIDSHQYKKTPPNSQENSLRKSVVIGANSNKKPWR